MKFSGIALFLILAATSLTSCKFRNFDNSETAWDRRFRDWSDKADRKNRDQFRKIMGDGASDFEF